MTSVSYSDTLAQLYSGTVQWYDGIVARQLAHYTSVVWLDGLDGGTVVHVHTHVHGRLVPGTPTHVHTHAYTPGTWHTYTRTYMDA